MTQNNLKEYAKGVIIQDAIISIFLTYLKTFDIEDDFSKERLDKIIGRFTDMYHGYVAATFEDLDIQTFTIGEINYIGVDELMLKIAGLTASKLAVEVLLLEMLGKLKD
jgi:hypothetical protein